MDARDDRPRDGKENEGQHEQNLGVELDHTGSVDARLATVERPEEVEHEAAVDVTGFAYDDEVGTVEVAVDVGRETVHLTFGPDEATALADHLALAAIHALGVDDDGA